MCKCDQQYVGFMISHHEVSLFFDGYILTIRKDKEFSRNLGRFRFLPRISSNFNVLQEFVISNVFVFFLQILFLNFLFFRFCSFSVTEYGKCLETGK